MAWYNTYRPNKIEEVIGQDLIKKIVSKSLESGSIKHAYLFYGPRGVGKTTIARIFANQITGASEHPERSVDIIELDAASNRRIDDVRLLKESATVTPLYSPYKVFIIDEVHMLTPEASNALLKLIEEPPTYLIFLLATTNPEKILPTVLSRLTKLPLSNHSSQDVLRRISFIAEQEKVLISQEALQLIAEKSNGSQRDAINMLETVAGYGLTTITIDDITQLLGVAPELLITELSTWLIAKSSSVSDMARICSQLDSLGIDPLKTADQLLQNLLQQSLNGVDVRVIVDALVRVISAKLSLPRHQVLALVVYNLSKKNSTQPFDDVIIAPNNESLSNSGNKKVQKQSIITEKQNNSIEVPKTEVAAKENTVKPDGVEDTTSPVDVLLDLRLAPKALALISDLSIQVSDNKIVLGTSVGMFLPTLKSPIIQQWIQDQLRPRFPTILKVEVVQLNTPVFKKELKPKQKIETEHKTTKKPFEYFVYNELPEGTTEGLKVYEGEIPVPMKTDLQSNSPKSFDDHVNELFELE